LAEGLLKKRRKNWNLPNRLGSKQWSLN